MYLPGSSGASKTSVASCFAESGTVMRRYQLFSQKICLESWVMMRCCRFKYKLVNIQGRSATNYSARRSAWSLDWWYGTGLAGQRAYWSIYKAGALPRNQTSDSILPKRRVCYRRSLPIWEICLNLQLVGSSNDWYCTAVDATLGWQACHVKYVERDAQLIHFPSASHHILASSSRSVVCDRIECRPI